MSKSNLSAYQWNNRLIVVSEATSASQDHFESIEKTQKKAWTDRKLKLVVLKNEDYKSWDPVKGKAESVALLIGLDGSVKKTYTTLPDFKEILTTIDAMPMRQHEVRQQSPD